MVLKLHGHFHLQNCAHGQLEYVVKKKGGGGKETYEATGPVFAITDNTLGGTRSSQRRSAIFFVLRHEHGASAAMHDVACYRGIGHCTIGIRVVRDFDANFRVAKGILA